MNVLTNFAKALRMLSVDAVEKAQSGHPGMPLGMADIAAVLWQQFLKYNPQNPYWYNRDRFVLSNGHGCMLLYSLLHLTGYNLRISDLQQFRQLNSKTPGHPEHGDTPGVETTTGPLGQGLANAIGMALAEKLIAAEFNKPNLELVNHRTYAFVGDGCLMEGISHEASSLAGVLGLHKLIVFYDDNGISIDGPTEKWFRDDTKTRFQAYHWNVIGPIDGHNPQEITAAIEEAKTQIEKPTLIICKTTIGFASPVANNEKAHGAPLGSAGVTQVRQQLEWTYPPFTIPEEMYAQFNHIEQGQYDENQWLTLCHHYQQQYPQEYYEFLRRINGDLPDEWPQAVRSFVTSCLAKKDNWATRKCSQHCLEFFAKLLPEMLGGSADLTVSNNTNWSGSKTITDREAGNYLYYGVREFGMAAIMNGIAVHGGFIPYGGTFLVFTDYARNAIRLSAIMHQRVIYVLTHDSIGLGEDGPTHQPIEHAAMLRLTPNMHVWRPADLTETATAWACALQHHTGPSALLLTRQNIPPLEHLNDDPFEKISKGGYILRDCENPEVILFATGSEVHLSLAAAQKSSRRIRVVSMPCCERFLAQDSSYQEEVIPSHIRKRLAVEAAATGYWYRFVGLDGKVIGVDRFGVSAPAAKAFEYLGITVERIVEALSSL